MKTHAVSAIGKAPCAAMTERSARPPLMVLMASCLLAAALILGPAPAWSTSFLERAQQYYEEGDLASAAIELKNALQRAPDNAEARYLLGRVHLETGDYAASQKELLRAWELGLQTGELRLLLARARLALRDYSGVLDAPQPDLDLSAPLMQDFLVARGEALFALGKVREAAQTFQDVLGVAPHARAYAGLARVAFSNGLPGDALALINEALKIEPKNADFHALVGSVYSVLDRPNDANASFDRALEFDPRNVQALVSLARLKLQARDYSGAELYIDRSLGLPGTRISHLVLKSYLELALRDYRSARVLAEEVLAVDTRNLTALYVAGTAAFALNELEQAKSRLTQYLSVAREDVHARAVLDNVVLALGSEAEPLSGGGSSAPLDNSRRSILDLVSVYALNVGAAQISRRSLEILTEREPENPGLRARLSSARAQSGDLTRAEDELSQAVKLDEGLRYVDEVDRATAVLILSHNQNGSFAKAIEIAQEFRDRRPDNPAPYSILALTYVEMDDQDKARVILEQGLRTLPNSPVLLGNLAAISIRLGNLEKAYQLLDQSLEHNGEHYSTLLRLANLSFATGAYANTQIWAERAIAVNQAAREPKVLLARSVVLSGEHQRGLTLAKGFLESDPASWRVLEVVGEAQFRLGQGEEAVATFEALVEQAGSSTRGHFFLARSYALVGQFDKVWPQFEKALEINPRHYPTRLAYARLALSRDEPDRAAPQIESLAAQFNDNPEVQEVAGQLALARGQLESAVELLSEAEEGFAKGGIYRLKLTKGLFEAHWRSGQHEEALFELQQWLERKDDDTEVRLQLATVLLRLGRREMAEQQFALIVEQQPSNWVARNELALLLLAKGEVAEALAQARAAHRAAGDVAEVMDSLGVVLLADGSLSDAVEMLQSAHELSPNNPEIALHLGQAMVQSGDASGAQALLDRFLARAGSFAGRNEMEELRRTIK